MEDDVANSHNDKQIAKEMEANDETSDKSDLDNEKLGHSLNSTNLMDADMKRAYHDALKRKADETEASTEANYPITEIFGRCWTPMRL